MRSTKYKMQNAGYCMSQFEWLEIGCHMTRDMCPIVSFSVTSFIVRKGQKKQSMSNCSHKESNEIKVNFTFVL